MFRHKIASFYALGAVVATLLSGAAQAQQTGQQGQQQQQGDGKQTDTCPFQPDCCEDDCCGPGTVWTGARCEFLADSPGWEGPGSNNVAYEVGCVPRRCCNEDCCDSRYGTEFNSTFQPLGRCTPTCQLWMEQVPTNGATDPTLPPIEQGILTSPPGIFNEPTSLQPCARLPLALPRSCLNTGVELNFDYDGDGVDESWATAPLTDAAGTTVQVACLRLATNAAYHLLVNGVSAGKCPWFGGRNSAWVYGVDDDGDGFIDRYPNGTIVEFIKTLWVSADGPLPGEAKFTLTQQQQGQTMQQQQQQQQQNQQQQMSPMVDNGGNVMRWSNQEYIDMLDDDQDGKIAITTYVYKFMDGNATKFVHDVELDGSNRAEKSVPVVFVPGTPEDTPGSNMAPFRRNLQEEAGADIYAMGTFQDMETEEIVYQACPQPNATLYP